MSGLPKIVTERLRVADRPASHPDADRLAAFSERRLTGRERSSVLEHLAICGDCREILALSLPVSEMAEPKFAPASRSWFAWPVLRWGLVAAGIVAIGSFATLQYRRSSETQMVAFQTRSQVTMHEEASDRASAAPTTEPASRESAERKAAATARTLAAGEQRPSKPVGADTSSVDQITGRNRTELPERRRFSSRDGLVPQTHGPKVQWQNNLSGENRQASTVATIQAAQAQAAPNPLPGALDNASPESSNLKPSDSAATSANQTEDQEALALPTQGMPLAPNPGGQGHTVERAKDPGTFVFGRTKVPAGSLASAPAAGTYPVAQASASWMVTAGGLARSLDQGKTWQNVDVNNSPAPAGADDLVLAPPVSQPPSTGGAVKAKKTSSTLSPPPTVFRAVASNGADVWAGGSNGSLYHSSDAGSHWEQIIPSSAGTSLTGDVVSLDFPDSQHGKVSTSTGEVWLTGDAGKNWQKR